VTVLQTLYRLEFVAGIAAAGGFAVIFILSLLPFARVQNDLLLYAVTGVVVVFFPISLALAHCNRKSHTLRLPAGISRTAFLRALAFSLALAGAVLIYGLYSWPYAPIKPRGTEYLDKLGRTFTGAQYENFRRWEAAYLSAWGAAVLLGLLALPFYRKEDRRHVFDGGASDDI
jgi:hypothetical protein